MAAKKNYTAAEDDYDMPEEVKAVNNLTLADDPSEEVFELLAGYVDADGVVHKEFTLREMTGRDQEAVNKPDVRGNGSKAIAILLTRCVTRLGSITPKSAGLKWNDIIKNLYAGDQEYIMLQLRRISIGSEITFANICPNPDCKAKLNTVIDVNELEIIPFNGVREITFELPTGYRDRKGVLHKTGTMRRVNGYDREILTPMAKANIARAETVMLTRLCKFDDGTPIDEDVMAGLVIRDRDYLQKLLEEHNFGLKMGVQVACDQCGAEFTASLNTANFM